MRNRLIWSVIISGITAIILAAPVLSAEPHENPLKTGWEYSGLELFRYYSSALDEVISKNEGKVTALLDKMPYANLPTSLTDATETFAKSMEECTELLLTIEKELDELQILLQQSRILEANLLANQIIANLSSGYRVLQRAENAILVMGKAFLVDAEKPNSPLRLAYDEVIRKLATIRAMFNLHRDIQANLIEGYVSKDVINAIRAMGTISIIDANYATDTSGVVDENEGVGINITEINIQLTESIAKSRLDTELSLMVEPVDVFVGDNVSVNGTLTSPKQPLANRRIEIMLNGSIIVTSVTDGNGNYEASFQIPYEYSKSMVVQALYYPRNEDVTTYLASLSPEIVLNIYFYQMFISLEAEAKGYPGRETVMEVSWTYEPGAPSIERQFEVQIDDVVVAQLSTTEKFLQKIDLPSDIQLGLHRLTVISFADGRYAAGEASKVIDVVKVAPSLNINLPRIMIIPRSYEIHGSLTSELGPLQMALVRVKCGADIWEFYSADDGSFSGSLTLHYTFGLIGSESWMIDVVPEESWNSPISSSHKIFVINGINCGIFLALLLTLGIFLPMKLRIRMTIPRWQRRRKQAEYNSTGAQQPAVEPVYGGNAVNTKTIGIENKAVEEPGARILSWYVSLIRLVQRVSGMILKPHQTLREFVNGTRKRLGPITDYLLEFTRLIERFLYSREQVNDNDVARSEQLARRVRDGLDNENT